MMVINFGWTEGIWIAVIIVLFLSVFFFIQSWMAPRMVAKEWIRSELEQISSDGAYLSAPDTSVWHDYIAKMNEDLRWLSTKDWKDIHIVAYDGIMLRASVVTPKKIKGTVFFFHEHKSRSDREFASIGKFYYQKGYRLVLCQMRAHIPSQGRYSTLGVKEQKDIESWLAWWKKQDASSLPLVLHGHGLGASSVLHYLALHAQNDVSFAIVDEPYANVLESPIFLRLRDLFGKKYNSVTKEIIKMIQKREGVSLKDGDYLKEVTQIQTSILFFSTNKDYFATHDTEALYQSCGAAKKQLIQIRDAEHGEGYYHSPELYESAIEEYMKER